MLRPFAFRATLLLTLSLLLALGGCDPDPGPADGGSGADAGPRPDAGPVPDAGPAPDAGPRPDGGMMMPGDRPIPAEFRFCEGTSGEVIEADPSDYRDRLSALLPGQTLRLAAGTYDRGLPIQDMNGSEGSCFLIEGPESGAPAIFTGSSSRNTVSLRNSSYVWIRNLELDGVGEAGDGVKAEGDSAYAHHIGIENLYIHGHGANQQIVGISTKCPAWTWVIRGNRIEGAGTGVYLGNSDGSRPFVGGLIEGNLIVDTVGYNMQIKHQNDRPAGLGIPDTARTIVRYNVFSKANNASTGGSARPNLLIGHFPLSGPGASDHYEIYANFFWDNPTERLFQGEGNVAFYNNVLFNPNGDALSFQPHNDVPREVFIFFNTVIASGLGIGLSGAAADATQVVAGNASFAPNPINFVGARENVTGEAADSEAELGMPAGDPGAGLDLHPQAGHLEGAVDTTGFEAFLESDRDFDRRPREASFRGAYAGPAGAESWALDLVRRSL